MPIHERVRHRREVLGLSQRDLSAHTRIPQTIISRIERGVIKNPGADVLKRLARALHCSIDYLVGMYEDPEDHTPRRAVASG